MQRLIVDLILTFGMERQIVGSSDLDANLHAIELYRVAEYFNIAAFVGDLGHFEMMRLDAIDDTTHATLLGNIASLIFGIFEGFAVPRDGHNYSSVVPAPSTHPSEQVKHKGSDITFLVEQERLDASWTLADLYKIGTRALCAAHRTEESLQSAIDSCDYNCTFDSA
uniref:Uncharacterized protein n=1 Tax=Hyaloperonospora arabidopsidis (strain Emoy2) TaxID=559515 RepID=M4BBX1_HYAAE